MSLKNDSVKLVIPRRSRLLFVTSGVCAAVYLFFSGSAVATTKGLSQIVTPDVQPLGDLSMSFQWQSEQIGNPYEFQAELGLTKFFEGAVFEGVKPAETIFAAELSLIQKEPYLLSTGFANWSTNGQAPQPYLLGGYYTEHNKLIAGIQAVHERIEAILGYAYDFTKQYRLQVDFQSGRSNFFTFGATWTPNDFVSINPAIYFSNEKPSNVSGYIVFTFTKHLFGPKEP
jgi:hypothetical protein